jgi:hypothetical protein
LLIIDRKYPLVIGVRRNKIIIRTLLSLNH